MNMNQWLERQFGGWLGRVAMGIALGSTAFATHAGGRPQSDAEVVIEWNEILERAAPGVGLSPPREYATLHVAMFDAVNSIEGAYRPYRLKVHAGHGASSAVAAAQAAHDVLSELFPASQQIFDDALQARIAATGSKRSGQAIQVGQQVAQAVLAWRRDDGWNTTLDPFVQPQVPGLYSPTPPNFSAPSFRQMQVVKPFALLTPTQFLPAAPATIISERYATDYAEVKALGAANSTERTAEQTQLARSFANVTSRTSHWAIWNHVARDTVRGNNLSLAEAARVFALLNVSIHDGVQTSHTSKFVYGAWRPITAIHRGEEDLNPLTQGDPTWQPLLVTPPYPSHAGNMACVGASAARILGLIYDSDAAQFTATWIGSNGNPDVARQYTRFSQLALDQANSRIYGGIHFRYESEASQDACPKIAEYVFANFLRPYGKRH